MTRLSRPIFFALLITATVLFSSSSTAQAQTDANSKETGSISGRVTVGGKAAAGITVAAFGGDSYPRRAAVQTITDIEGRYRLFGLGPGTYQVQALAPTLVNGEVNNNPYGTGKAILLSAAEAAEDINLKLARGAVITGRITDEEGKPVVEERVNIEPVSPMADPMQQMQMSRISMTSPMYRTDDRGIYRLYGLMPGRYKVSVGMNGGLLPGNARGRFTQVFFGDTNDAAKAVILELTEGGEASNIDIRLGHRSSTYSVTGRVVDSDAGTPISGARLTYGRVSGTEAGSGVSIGGLPTNDRGEFRFDGLESGRYTIYLSSHFEGGDYYSQPIFFDVIDRDVTNLEIKGVRGLSLSGTVVPESDAGKNAAAQLAGLRITANVRTAANPSTNSGSAMVAADGSFSINGMAPGKVSLYLYSVTNGNSRRFSVTRIEANGLDQTEGIDLPSGRSVSNIRVFVSYGTGVIRGAVKFENGNPPPGTRIFVNARRDGKRVSNGAMVDARGHFLIPDLPPGNYEVTLNADFFGPTSSPSQRYQQPPKQFITVSDDAEVEVNFTIDMKQKEGGP